MLDGKTVRFVIVGTAMAGVYFVLCFAFFRLTPLPASLVGPLAYACVIPFSYLAQHRWAFRSRRPHGSAFWRYVVVQATMALLSALAAYFSKVVLDAPPSVAAALTTICVGLGSLVLSRIWVFSDGEAQAE